MNYFVYSEECMFLAMDLFQMSYSMKNQNNPLKIISMEKLKWIVLMILLSQPDEEIAFSRMEDIVYNLIPTYLH